MTTASTPPAGDAGLRRYDATAEAAAAVVLRRYSTSFGLATTLLAREMRPHIAAVYGLVRVADEIVDGPAEAAGLDADGRREILDRLEAEVHAVRDGGYSANLIVHAFGRTADRFGIGDDLTAPFFASMRADLSLTSCTREQFDRYVYGSAEVIGLMCLRVFTGVEPHPGPADPARTQRLEEGARRLGSAFQKINFLRDLGEDVRTLGRSYFPGVVDGVLDESAKAGITASIRADLAAAARTLDELPRGARPAVAAAHMLFTALTDRVEKTPAAALLEQRVRVPDAVKLAILTRAMLRRGRRR